MNRDKLGPKLNFTVENKVGKLHKIKLHISNWQYIQQ